MPPLVRPIRRPLWSPAPLFRPQAGRRAMRLEVGRVNHHRLRNGGLRSQPIHHPGEDPLVAPPLPSIVEGLRWGVFLRRIAPPQPIAIYKDYAAQHTPAIDTLLTVALGKEGLQTGHLRVGQPKRLLIDRSPCGGFILPKARAQWGRNRALDVTI